MTFGVEKPLLEQFTKRGGFFLWYSSTKGPDRPGISLLRVDYHHGIRQGVGPGRATGAGTLRLSVVVRACTPRSRAWRAFLRSLEECGIDADPEWIVEGDHTHGGQLEAMGRLLNVRQRPTAVMCSNDMTDDRR